MREDAPMSKRRRSKAPQSRVVDAWVIFRLSTTPISTAQDGDFHCAALMDIPSGFLIGIQMVPLGTEDELGAAADSLSLFPQLGESPLQSLSFRIEARLTRR